MSLDISLVKTIATTVSRGVVGTSSLPAALYQQLPGDERKPTLDEATATVWRYQEIHQMANSFQSDQLATYVTHLKPYFATV